MRTTASTWSLRLVASKGDNRHVEVFDNNAGSVPRVTIAAIVLSCETLGEASPPWGFFMDQREDEAMTANEVVITVLGGVAELMSAPYGVAVVIYDYDVDGCDPDELEADMHGSPCIIREYPAEGGGE